MQNPDELTGEEMVERMDPDARAEAEKELSQIEPGGSEPFRIGSEGSAAELDENPISEGGASRQNRP